MAVLLFFLTMPRRSRKGIACAALLSAAALLRGAAAVPIDAGYHVRTWTTDDGVPHNSVSRIVQDHAGFLWFATVGGLARFDGREFRAYRLPAEHRALGYNIRGLAVERPGTLLVSATGDSLLRLTGGTWSAHPATALLAELRDAPMEMHVDAAGVLWLATSGGRVVRWSVDGVGKVFGPLRGFASRTRRVTFAPDPSGNMLACADSLVVLNQANEPARHPLDARGPRLIGAGRDGRVWLCTDRALLQLDRGRVVSETEIPLESELGALRHLLEDRLGAVWIATTRQGLIRVLGGRTTRVTAYPGASSAMEDREGNIWMASDGGGVGQLREKSYQLFNIAAGLPQEIVSAVAEDNAGAVWLANRSGGLVRIGVDGRPQPSGLAGPRFFANVVAVDADNRVWFGGGRNGLMRWNPEGGAEPAQMPAPAANLHLLFRARNGDMWFTADPGLLGRYRGEDLRMFSAADGFTPQEIRAIAQDARGDLWLGGRRAELLRWDGERFEHFDAARGFPRELIHALWADADGRLWIGTANGLVLKDGERFRVLTEEHGLADDILQQILEDDRGHLWFAARRGLFYAAKAQVLDVARGAAARIESHRIGPNEGLVGLSPTPNYQPAAARTADGRLWFATAQGAVSVDPARVPRDLPPLPVLIEEVRLDGKNIPVDATLRVPSGRHRIEFKFAALSFTAPERVLVRHQLEGADPEWTDTGSDRAVSYANLPPGNYRLRVIARNSAGQWNTEGATLAFTVVPAWWETTAFRAGAIVLLTLLTAWLARAIAQRRLQQRLKRLEQEHALEKERHRIARDLHDDLGASLTELGLLADRLATSDAQKVGPQLAGLAWRTRRLSAELSGIVWTMSPRNATLDRLGEFIRQYAQRLFRGLPTACLVKVADRLPETPLAPDLQHQIIAVTREALNNVLKHSAATEVVIELRHVDGEFEVAIADNGRGFAPAAAAEADGNGLRNIRTRTAEIGGRATIDSAPGSGTRVTLRVPLVPVAPAR